MTQFNSQVMASITSFKASKDSFGKNLCPSFSVFKNWRIYIMTPAYGRNDYAVVLSYWVSCDKVIIINEESVGSKRVNSWDNVTNIVKSYLSQIVDGEWDSIRDRKLAREQIIDLASIPAPVEVNDYAGTISLGA